MKKFRTVKTVIRRITCEKQGQQSKGSWISCDKKNACRILRKAKVKEQEIIKTQRFFFTHIYFVGVLHKTGVRKFSES